jgi:hypothetical protein
VQHLDALGNFGDVVVDVDEGVTGRDGQGKGLTGRDGQGNSPFLDVSLVDDILNGKGLPFLDRAKPVPAYP